MDETTTVRNDDRDSGRTWRRYEGTRCDECDARLLKVVPVGIVECPNGCEQGPTMCDDCGEEVLTHPTLGDLCGCE